MNNQTHCVHQETGVSTKLWLANVTMRLYLIGGALKKVLLQPNFESSSSTPESLVKLAKESLQIGELLGVRVTRNVEAAISRITTPLKKLRNKGKKSKRFTKV